MDSFGYAKVFTSLDCTAGYWQEPLRPADREKTAFTTNAGIFHWLSMPFGLTNAPATFQRALDIIYCLDSNGNFASSTQMMSSSSLRLQNNTSKTLMWS